MYLTIKGWNGEKGTVELGEDDTPAVLRRKVASAVGLPEDGFAMSFGGEAVDEGYDMTQLSAGDTVVLTKVTKFEARAALHALGETDITAERLTTVRDPEVARLLLQAEVATVIPQYFLRRASLTSLDLSAESVVTQIGDGFLRKCTSLTSINLSGLIHVTQVDAYFLHGCRSLRTLDLTALSNVMLLGPGFLNECSALCSLDLTPLSNITQIRQCFLFGCSALRTLDFLPLSRVTRIEASFLFGCSALCTLDLAPLSSITQVDEYFLHACSSLCSLDLTPLSNVTQIKSCFLDECSSLRTLDVSPLSRVTHIDGTYLMGKCTSLESIYLTGCSDVVSSKVKKLNNLKKLVVESRPKRSKDEPLEESRKRLRHAE